MTMSKSLLPVSRLPMTTPRPNLALAQMEPGLTRPPSSSSIPMNSHDRVVCSRWPRFGNTDTTLGCSAFFFTPKQKGSKPNQKPVDEIDNNTNDDDGGV
jgi:hypothetical protein